MRYVLLFAAVMSLLTTHARVRGTELDPQILLELAKAKRLREASQSAKVPPAPVANPVRNIDPDHTCDKCGAYSNVVARQANGMHSHVCTNPACRNEWWHADPGAVQVQPTFTLPASGCANGQCPSATTYQRRGLIFWR